MTVMSPSMDMSESADRASFNGMAPCFESKIIQTPPITDIRERFIVFRREYFPNHPVLSITQLQQLLNVGAQSGSLKITPKDKSDDQLVQFALVLLVSGISQWHEVGDADLIRFHSCIGIILEYVQKPSGSQHVAAHVWAAWFSKMLDLKASFEDHIKKAIQLNNSLVAIALEQRHVRSCIPIAQSQVLGWSCHLLLR